MTYEHTIIINEDTSYKAGGWIEDNFKKEIEWREED